MLKTLHLNLFPHFGIPRSTLPKDAPDPLISVRGASIQHYREGSDYAVAQAFDARDCYLYSYDIALQENLRIPVDATMADLHACYLLRADQAVTFCGNTGEILTTLSPERARYLYLPRGRYQLHLAPGSYCFFGFYFDGGLFRDGNERPFGFLHEAIEAYRINLPQPVTSIDFPAGARTLNQIIRFCGRIKKGDIKNEKFVLTELIRLFLLAKEKVFDEYERTSDPELLIQRCRKLLAEYIADQGNTTRIKDIALQLNVRPEYLSRLHQQYYQQKLNDYRDGLVMEKICGLLKEHYTSLEISVLCGFPGASELNRFFKRKTGMTPARYRRLHK